MDLQGKELEDAFDDFLQTPILGRKKKKPELDIEAGGEDLEQGKIRVNVEPHQAASRGDASAKMGPSGEAICGGGQSQSMQPQVVWGFCLLRGLSGRPMGDLHVAEIRIIHGKEVSSSIFLVVIPSDIFLSNMGTTTFHFCTILCGFIIQPRGDTP